MPLAAGYIKDITGSYALSFYISAVILVAAVILCILTRRPTKSSA
jgi:cyanate permease